MADGPSTAKKSKLTDLPECPYGSKCYRKNRQHFKDFSHAAAGPSTSDSEEQRKELIKKAFEAKKQLQEELEATKKQITEKDKELDKLQTQDSELDTELEKYNKSQLAPSSSVFKNLKIMFGGKFCAKQIDINNLVKNHGAEKATMTTFNLLVTTDQEIVNGTKKVCEVKKRKVPMVTEDYIYDCILEKNMKPIAEYELEL